MLAIENYHENTEKVLLQMAINPKNGFWAPVCVDHVYSMGGAYYSQNFRIPAGSDNSVDQTLVNWMANQGPHTHLDTGKWP